MKTLNLKDSGLSELETLEQSKIDGGIHSIMWYIGYAYGKAEGGPATFYFN